MATRTTDVRVRVGADMAELQKRFADGQLTAERFAAQMDKVQARMQALGAEEAKAARENIEFNRAREASVRQMATVEAAAYAEQKRMDEARVASMAKVGTAFAGVGIAVGVGLAMATKAAMDWEASFANVAKVVGTNDPLGLQVLDGQLRGLAKTLPVSADEIAQVATNAAQLGVARQDLAAFTKVAVDLGQTTALSANDAATGLAQLANIMGTLPSDVSRAGSALVYLGNNGASTEQQILDMATRIAGAGRVIGLTEAQVLGFASAITSTGVEAEAGGTAISKTFIKIDQAAHAGGATLDEFASIAGESSAAFSAHFGRDAAGATVEFIQGLDRLQKSGGDVFGVLKDLGMSDARLERTLLSAAGASDLLTKSVQGGTDAWAANQALTDAAAAKYDTAAARVQIARNNINDAAITIGQALLPALAGAADKVAALAQAFESLPGPAKSALAQIGAVGAVAATFGGTALFLVPKLVTMAESLDKIGPSGARAASAFRGLAGAAGPIALGLTAATLALGYWVDKQAEAKQRVDELKQTLDQQTGAITENTREWTANHLQQSGVLDSAHKLGLSLTDVTDAALGNADALGRVNAALDHAGSTATTGYVAGAKAAGAATSSLSGDINGVRDAIGGQNSDLEAAKRQWQDLRDATGTTAGAQDAAGGSIDSTTGKLQTQTQSAKDAKTAIDDFDKALQALYDQELGLGAAQDAAQAKLNDLVKSYQDATTKTVSTGGSGKSKSQVAADAKMAGDQARLRVADEGGTRAQASAAAKLAADQVRASEKGTAAGKAQQKVDVDVANGKTSAAIQIRDAIRSVIDADLKLLDEMKKTGASQDDINAKADDMAGQFDKLSSKFGLTKAQAKAYSDVLREVPSTVTTAVTATGLPEINADLGLMVTRIGIINGTPVKLSVDANAGNVRENRTALSQQSGPGFFQQNQQPLSPQVVVVPVSSTHTTAQTVHVGKVVAKDPTVFLSRRFGANGVG